jgi:rubrerythrin
VQRFIARENIRRYRQQLEAATDPKQREMLEQLLADEEALLRELEAQKQRLQDPPPRRAS